MAKIQVTDKDGGRKHHISKQLAATLVRCGKASWTSKKAIQLIAKINQFESSSICSGGQAAAYELSAIEKNPRFFSGGLIRTEHRPIRIPKFQAARVGH